MLASTNQGNPHCVRVKPMRASDISVCTVQSERDLAGMLKRAPPPPPSHRCMDAVAPALSRMSDFYLDVENPAPEVSLARNAGLVHLGMFVCRRNGMGVCRACAYCTTTANRDFGMANLNVAIIFAARQSTGCESTIRVNESVAVLAATRMLRLSRALQSPDAARCVRILSP